VETLSERKVFFLEGVERAGQFWLDFVERHQGETAALAAERDNVLQAIAACRFYAPAWRTAAELAIRFRDPMMRLGFWRLWEQCVADLLAARSDDCSLEIEAQLQCHLGFTLRRQARSAEWVATAEALLARLRRAGASWQRADCLRELGSHYFDLGRWDDAEALGREMLTFVTPAYEDGVLADAYILLGRACRARGEWQAAIGHFTAAVNYGDPPRYMSAHNFLALLYLDIEQPRQALDHLEAALEVAERMGERPGQGVIRGNMGRAYLALGRLDLALAQQESALALSREAHNRPSEMHILAFLGDVYRALEQEARAEGYYQQSLALAQELGADAWVERMERALSPGGASAARPGPSRRPG
jgi:tetratricopeptide (TPR) repeat protein